MIQGLIHYVLPSFCFRDLDKYDIENLMNQNLDYNAAFAMTSELVAMEIINRIFICIFEVCLGLH